MVKIKIKINNLEGKINPLIRGLNCKKQIPKKKEKYENQIKKKNKTKHNKFRLKGEIENNQNLDKRTKKNNNKLKEE